MKRYIRSATYNGMEFNDYQMYQIRRGLESGVDVSVYADPKYSDLEMRQIREGLEAGLDVRVYANPKFAAGEMQQIREGLEDGLDVSIYADPKFSELQMVQIRIGLKAGLDVSTYADPKFSWMQMERIRKGSKAAQQPFNLTSKKIVAGVQEALGVSTDIAKIMVKWYAEDENPNDCETIDEYVDELIEAVPYSLEEFLRNEDMEDIRDEDPKYAREIEKVAKALGMELDD